MYTVYMHKFPNNKVYIGITRQSVSKRWASNGYNYNRYFKNAVKKYGWDNVEHLVLITNVSKQWAEYIERSLIAQYESNNPNKGYNLTSGGEGTKDYKHSLEVIERIRNSNKGQKRNDEVRKHISEAKKGKPSGKKGKPLSEETKRKIGNANRHPMSDETKQKISKTLKGRPSKNKGKPMSEAQKLKISYANKGKIHSKEHNEKVALAHKGKKFSKEHRQALSDAHKNYKMPEAQKEKIRQALLEYHKNKAK